MIVAVERNFGDRCRIPEALVDLQLWQAGSVGP
jgi:hypothetical protein